MNTPAIHIIPGVVACVIALTAGLTACVPGAETRTPAGDLDAVRYVENTLPRSLQPTRITHGRQGDQLHIRVHLRNASAFDLGYRYRFVWFDPYDLEVAPGHEPWRRALISGGGRMHVTGLAPSPRATRFELWLQPG